LWPRKRGEHHGKDNAKERKGPRETAKGKAKKEKEVQRLQTNLRRRGTKAPVGENPEVGRIPKLKKEQNSSTARRYIKESKKKRPSKQNKEGEKTIQRKMGNLTGGKKHNEIRGGRGIPRKGGSGGVNRGFFYFTGQNPQKMVGKQVGGNGKARRKTPRNRLSGYADPREKKWTT